MFTLFTRDEEREDTLINFKLPNIFDEKFQAPKAVIPQLENLDLEANRVTKVNSACPHKDKKHYAKNMCNNCYHRQGRVKAAWACPHTNRRHYAKGKCQFCYIQNYHRSRVLREDDEIRLQSLSTE